MPETSYRCFYPLNRIIFIVIGYSVAKPFGEIGEVKNSSSSPDSTVITESYGKDTENISKGTKAYWIKDMEIESLEALDSILDKVDKNYNMVVIPLKIEGGKLNYNSSNEGAVLAEAGNEIPISSITEAVKATVLLRLLPSMQCRIIYIQKQTKTQAF